MGLGGCILPQFNFNNLITKSSVLKLTLGLSDLVGTEMTDIFGLIRRPSLCLTGFIWYLDRTKTQSCLYDPRWLHFSTENKKQKNEIVETEVFQKFR